MVRERYADQGGEVKGDIDPFHRLAHSVRVADVAHEHVQLALFQGGQRVEPAPRVEGVVEDEGAHAATFAQQRLTEMTADEAVRAGDKHTLVVEFHGLAALLSARAPPGRAHHTLHQPPKRHPCGPPPPTACAPSAANSPGDRRAAPQLACSARHGPRLQPASAREGWPPRRVRDSRCPRRPVSYTHLTLPTIYSV